MVFNRTAFANILVAVAELLLAVGKSLLMNQFKRESMYCQIKLYATTLKKFLLSSMLYKATAI